MFEIADEVQEVGVQRNSLEENMQMIRQSQVARCFQVIARQHAKPARKNGQALGHTEFRGEIRHRKSLLAVLCSRRYQVLLEER